MNTDFQRGVNQKLWLSLWGGSSVQVSDCLPYLKCFNVEDVVNIRFSFQNYLCDTAVNKQQVTTEKGSKKKQTNKKIIKKQMDVAKTGKCACFGCKKKRKKKYFYQLFFCACYSTKWPNCSHLCKHDWLWLKSSTEQERSHLAVKSQRRSTCIMHSSCGKKTQQLQKTSVKLPVEPEKL